MKSLSLITSFGFVLLAPLCATGQNGPFDHWADSNMWVNGIKLREALGGMDGFEAQVVGLFTDAIEPSAYCNYWTTSGYTKGYGVTWGTAKGVRVAVSQDRGAYNTDHGCFELVVDEEIKHIICYASNPDDLSNYPNLDKANIVHSGQIPMGQSLRLYGGMGANYGAFADGGIWTLDTSGELDTSNLNSGQVVLAAYLGEVVTTSNEGCAEIESELQGQYIPANPCPLVEFEVLGKTSNITQTVDGVLIVETPIGSEKYTFDVKFDTPNSSVYRQFKMRLNITQDLTDAGVSLGFDNDSDVDVMDVVCWGPTPNGDCTPFDEEAQLFGVFKDGSVQEQKWTAAVDMNDVTPYMSNDKRYRMGDTLTKIIFTTGTDSCKQYSGTWSLHDPVYVNSTDICTHFEFIPTVLSETEARCGWLPKVEVYTVAVTTGSLIKVPNSKVFPEEIIFYRPPNPDVTCSIAARPLTLPPAGVVLVNGDFGQKESRFCYGLDGRWVVEGSLCEDVGDIYEAETYLERNCETNKFERFPLSELTAMRRSPCAGSGGTETTTMEAPSSSPPSPATSALLLPDAMVMGLIFLLASW
eukprot:GHVN01105945.1.p1 GENE.GHVN01105945.1~~GHVN01105945.1.p1  ORF type:complete len:582 (+),score=79.95 GHVN01105945.1:155-1900(+)